VAIPSSDTDVLFVSAISVFNRALDAHRGGCPYKRILSGLEALPRGRRTGIEVYEGDAKRPIARFAVRFHNGLIEPLAAESRAEDVRWRVSTEYLERVVAGAAAFVRHPARLDWDWLEDWAGADG
jgi:hypothetical protein